MKAYDFIFSNKLTHRLARHFTFWAIYLLQLIMITTRMESFHDFFIYQSYKISILSAFSVLPACLFSVYAFSVFLFPFLRQKKYRSFAVWLVIIIVFNCIISLLQYLFVRPFLCADCGAVTSREKINTIASIGINTVSFLGAVALGIKFTKTWYIQQVINRKLSRQKINNELKLLKARIQPDFLFETLEVLHHKITYNNKQAVNILLRFSDLLSYTLYECDEDFISAERVFQVTNEFVALETLMMKTKITITASITENLSDKYIPSFVVLPLLQHCIMALHNYPDKACQTEIEVVAENKTFTCSLFIYTEAFAELRKIYFDTISLFRNRLEAFYRNKYTIDFTEEKEMFTINLSLVLSDHFLEETVYADTAE